MRKQQIPQLSGPCPGCAELESKFRLLEQEWVETHRKLLNTLRSINRGGGKKAPDAAPAALESVPPALDPITQKILDRRNGKWVTQRPVPNFKE